MVVEPAWTVEELFQSYEQYCQKFSLAGLTFYDHLLDCQCCNCMWNKEHNPGRASGIVTWYDWSGEKGYYQAYDPPHDHQWAAEHLILNRMRGSI